MIRTVRPPGEDIRQVASVYIGESYVVAIFVCA